MKLRLHVAAILMSTNVVRFCLHNLFIWLTLSGPSFSFGWLLRIVVAPSFCFSLSIHAEVQFH